MCGYVVVDLFLLLVVVVVMAAAATAAAEGAGRRGDNCAAIGTVLRAVQPVGTSRVEPTQLTERSNGRCFHTSP